MKKTIMTLSAVTLITVAGIPGSAAELGMQAPPLDIATYVKGEPVKLDSNAGDRVHVVEFWATWCGPCRVSIPRLTELQEKFRDQNVTIVGITDEEVSTVEPYVAKMGDQMDYTVAVDDGRKTFSNYMAAFNQNGIPTAFIVDQQNRIVWFGHPMGELEQVLEQVVAGTYDLEAEMAKEEVKNQMVSYLNQTVGSEYSDAARKEGHDWVETTDDAQMLDSMAWLILTHEQIKHRDRDLALTAAKKAYELSEGNDASIIDTYARALYDTGRRKEAIQYQEEAVRTATNPEMKSHLQAILRKYQTAE